MTLMAESKNKSRLNRLENKLERYIADGKLYEAEQMYGTLCSRYQSQKKYDDAATLAASGAHRLLELKHASNAGVKLAMQLLKIYEEAKMSVTQERIEKLVQLFNAFPEERTLGRVKFMKTAIKWSATHGECRTGDSALHLSLATYFHSIADYGAAENFFLHAQSYKYHSEVLIEWAEKGFHSERDLFVTRCVLQYLCFQNLEGANKIFSMVLLSRPDIQSPLINFTRFLLQTMERNAAPLFQMLRSKYDLALQRDEAFSMLLDRIGKVFFDLKPSASSMSGILGDFLQMLETPTTTADDDDDDDDDDEQDKA